MVYTQRKNHYRTINNFSKKIICNPNKEHTKKIICCDQVDFATEMLIPYTLVRMAAIMKTNKKVWKGVDKEDTWLGENAN